jgi:hypothetical protein
MALPEEEKAVLSDSLANIEGGLSILYQRIVETQDKVTDLYSFVDKQQRIPGPAQLQKQLDEIRYALESIEDSRAFLRDYAQKARGVVDAIQKGVFDD